MAEISVTKNYVRETFETMCQNMRRRMNAGEVSNSNIIHRYN